MWLTCIFFPWFSCNPCYISLKWHTGCILKGQKVCSNRCLQQPSLDLFSAQENLTGKTGLGSSPKKTQTPPKIFSKGAAAQNVVDLLKQHVRFTVCVCFFWVIQLHLCWRGQMALLVCWLWALLKQLLHCKKLGEYCCCVLYMIQIRNNVDWSFVVKWLIYSSVHLQMI